MTRSFSRLDWNRGIASPRRARRCDKKFHLFQWKKKAATQGNVAAVGLHSAPLGWGGGAAPLHSGAGSVSWGKGSAGPIHLGNLASLPLCNQAASYGLASLRCVGTQIAAVKMNIKPLARRVFDRFHFGAGTLQRYSVPATAVRPPSAVLNAVFLPRRLA